MSVLWLLPIALLTLLLWRLPRYSAADWGGPWRNRIAGLNTLLCRHLHQLQAEPLALPASGPAVVAANHTSGLDPLLLIAASPRPLRFLIAAEEYRRFGFTWLFRLAGCIPVDRGGNPQRAYREALRRLAEGEVVALFPQGRIQPPGEPSPPLKGGVVRLAQLAGCAVLPVRIDGVGAAGAVLASVWTPSHARLRLGAPLVCEEGASRRECLDRLAQALVLSEQEGADEHD